MAWRYLDAIGEIEDFFVSEAQIIRTKRKRRKKIKYGLAGVALSFGMMAAYYIYKQKKSA